MISDGTRHHYPPLLTTYRFYFIRCAYKLQEIIHNQILVFSYKIRHFSHKKESYPHQGYLPLASPSFSRCLAFVFTMFGLRFRDVWPSPNRNKEGGSLECKHSSCLLPYFCLAPGCYTLKRKTIMSPSFTMYSFPSWRTSPFSLHACMVSYVFRSS